jgi:hypothetical protein
MPRAPEAAPRVLAGPSTAAAHLPAAVVVAADAADVPDVVDVL